jgi:hypothetical protein
LNAPIVETNRDIERAHQVGVGLLDDIAQKDADAKLDPALRGGMPEGSARRRRLTLIDYLSTNFKLCNYEECRPSSSPLN